MRRDRLAGVGVLAIIVGEAAFGVGGVVMAPIAYAFIKRELRDRGLV